MMKQQKTTVKTIDRQELDALIQRVEHAIEHDLSIEAADLSLLLLAIQTLLQVQSTLEEKDTTLLKLRKLLGMVNSSEKRSASQKSSKSNSKKKNSKPQTSPDRVPQTIEHHAIQEMTKGDQCPSCDIGKLYAYQPAEFLRITGHSPLSTTKHVIERLRCNACGELFTAKLSDEVLADGQPQQMFGYSARALLSMQKYFLASPFYRVENVQALFGTHIRASTQYDQCAAVAHACEPVYKALMKAAAQAKTFMVDDTHNKILDAQPVIKPNRHKKGHKLRTGVYSSGLIALGDDNDIVLYNTDIGHSGEFADEVLQYRDSKRPPPNYMGDASSNNRVSVCDVQMNLCNAHSRRQFKDIEHLFPEQAAWVLDQFMLIWQHDDESIELGHTVAQRLEYHQNKSLPVMAAIKQWCKDLLAKEETEQHDQLAKAQKYFVKHYEGLTAFCRYEGALIDNNRMEQGLKLVIRSRKNSLFYKTQNGADVGNILTSILATCAKNNINAYHYLIWVQQNRVDVAKQPNNYLPWCLEKEKALSKQTA